MVDLISRQAAIDAINELCDHYTPTKSTFHPHVNFVIEELQRLPSAQPESIWLPLTESDIDHLFDYYAKEKDENLTEQAQLLKECMWVGYMAAKKEQPERKKGKWIWNPDGMDWGLGAWCCSECRTKAETWWASAENCNPLRCSGSSYCGVCGADMRGEQDESI